MATANRVILIGNLTHDPELRRTPKGVAVADLRLATNRRYGPDDDREEVTFVDIVAWERAAENAQSYLSKGDPIYVEGRLKLNNWEDKQTGQPRSKLVVVAERIQFLSGRGGGERNAPSQQHRGSSAQRQGGSQGAHVRSQSSRQPAAASG